MPTSSWDGDDRWGMVVSRNYIILPYTYRPARDQRDVVMGMNMLNYD
jgi:hypothetical protein